MRFGVSGKPIPAGLPFASEVAEACRPFDIPPCLAYAIRQNETDSGTDPAVMQIGAIGDYMPDGSNAGHGIFQETSSWAQHWDDPLANSVYAIAVFILPAWNFWTGTTDLQGDDLIRCIGASFNAGLEQAWRWHLQGDVDAHTTARYGARVLEKFHLLIA